MISGLTQEGQPGPDLWAPTTASILCALYSRSDARLGEIDPHHAGCPRDSLLPRDVGQPPRLPEGEVEGRLATIAEVAAVALAYAPALAALAPSAIPVVPGKKSLRVAPPSLLLFLLLLILGRK